MKLIARIGLGLYSLVALVWVWMVPRNRFEWMLEDPALTGEALTYCTLPIDGSGEGRLFALLVIVPMLLLTLALSVKLKKIHYSVWLSVLLVAVWLLRFFVLIPSCR